MATKKKEYIKHEMKTQLTHSFLVVEMSGRHIHNVYSLQSCQSGSKANPQMCVFFLAIDGCLMMLVQRVAQVKCRCRVWS